MGEVYAIAGGKGGVGKTTATVNTGIALEQAGHDVAIVDADLGMTNLGGMVGIEHSPTIHDVLAGRAPLSEALVEGPAGVTVLPGSDRLEAFVDASPDNLRPLVEELRPAFDAVILDTGSGLCQETVVPMRAADSAILVTTPDAVAMADTRKMADLAETVDTGLLGAVVLQAQPETRVPEIADELDVTVLAAVPEDREAANDEPVVLNYPDRVATQAYRTLARKVSNVVEARA
jgi:septum site-determining protein MinD